MTIVEHRVRIADGPVAPARSLIEATTPELSPVVAPTVAMAVGTDPERSETADAAIDPVIDLAAPMPFAGPLATQRAVLAEPVTPATPVPTVARPGRAVSAASDSSVASVPGKEVSPAPEPPFAAPAVVGRSLAPPAVAVSGPVAAPAPAVSRTIGSPSVVSPAAVGQESATSRSANASGVAVQTSAPASTRPSRPSIGSPDPAPGAAVVGATVPTGGVVEPSLAPAADDLRSGGSAPSELSTDSHEDSAGADASEPLPLIGSVPLVPSPTPIDPSPSDVSSDPPLPPVTTSATTSIASRRTMIGEPLESGGGTVARAMLDDPGRAASVASESAGSAPIGPATAPTLGTQRSILPTSGPARSTDGPATDPPRAPAGDAVPIRHASSAAAEAPVSALPLVADSYVPSPAATLDVPAHGQRTVVGLGVARRVDSAAAGPPPAGNGTEPDRRADAGPTAVVSLLADRAFVTRPDGQSTTAGGALPTERVTGANPSPVAAGGPSSRPAGLPLAGVAGVAGGGRRVVAPVQRAVTGAPTGDSARRAGAGPAATPGWRGEATTIPSDPFAAGSERQPVLSPNMVFAPHEDGTLWAADDTTAPVALQREPDEASAAEAAPEPAPPTMTAVATAGPAAPATEAKPRSEAELQELCRALYPPLRRRLCRDLLVDRERAGYRTDIRF